MEEKLREALDPVKFIEWLESKEPDEVVGKANKPKSCPVARYLGDTFKPWWSGFVVGMTSVRLRESSMFVTEACVYLDDWFKHFIYAVDDRDDFADCTAKEALSIAHGIEVPA